MLIKLDLAKDFHKMNCQFMHSMLRALGFEEEWVNWIVNLTSSTFFSILLNGAPSQTFKSSRGIHQGDPLSLFLFILMVEGLGRLIKSKTQNEEIMGTNLHRHLETLTHQRFVDDTMFLGHPSVQEV